MGELTEKEEDSILTRKEIGKRGEEIAAEFLERKGLRIVERNYHCRWGELDLIAIKTDEEGFVNETYFEADAQDMSGNGLISGGNRVHFVEVKTRTGTSYGTPAGAVTYAKQQKIKKTALTWLQSQEYYFSGLSFDVIEVSVKDNTAKIRWLEHCF